MTEIISKKPITLSELYSIIKEIEKKEELDYRVERMKKYLEKLEILDKENAEKLKEELKELGIDEKFIVKIIDFLPKSKDELRAIFYGEISNQELFEKILQIVNKYI